MSHNLTKMSLYFVLWCLDPGNPETIFYYGILQTGKYTQYSNFFLQLSGFALWGSVGF